jgi:hypothetical protein
MSRKRETTIGGTYVIPDNVYRVGITLTGGAGGGSSVIVGGYYAIPDPNGLNAYGVYYAGTMGVSSEIKKQIVPVKPGDVLRYEIGTKGDSGRVNNSFDTTIHERLKLPYTITTLNVNGHKGGDSKVYLNDNLIITAVGGEGGHLGDIGTYFPVDYKGHETPVMTSLELPSATGVTYVLSSPLAYYRYDRSDTSAFSVLKHAGSSVYVNSVWNADYYTYNGKTYNIYLYDDDIFFGSSNVGAIAIWHQ